MANEISENKPPIAPQAPPPAVASTAPSKKPLPASLAKPPSPPTRFIHEPEDSPEHVEEETVEGAPMWYLSFADMMTNMFVFFALLVAIGTVEQEKFKKVAESLRSAFGTEEKGEGGTFRQLDLIHGQTKIDQTSIHAVDEIGALVNKEVNNILTDVKQFVSSHKLASKISAHSDERGAVITISDVVLFPQGEARITPEGIKIIKQIFEMLKDFDYEVKIEGHTDNSPIKTERFPSNWELSASRASDVARMLVESGFPPNKLAVEGFAQYRPKVPNDTDEHRAMNRRIEVVFQQSSIRKHMVSFLQKD